MQHRRNSIRRRALAGLVSLAATAQLLACGGSPNHEAEPASQQPAMGSPNTSVVPGQGPAGVLLPEPQAGDAIIENAATANPTSATPLGPSGPSPTGLAPGAVATPLPPQSEDLIAEPDPDQDVAPQPTVEVNTNPFVSVAHDPLSTFAADVDTASYDIFRRDVGLGSLPAPTTVRLEEFVNYFDYDYPAPSAEAEHPFAIDLAAAPTLLDNGTTLLRVGIQAELPPAFEKKPANLVFLIDTSGSMQSAEKLPLVQRVLTSALAKLEPSDTVSIVTYAGSTGVALAPTPVSDSTTISGVINSLGANGSTNGAGGIQLAYQQAASAYLEGGINHVILCTDGDFNVGVSDTAGLVSLIEEERRSGITFTALGFGASNNDAMMEAISNAGNGVYGVIATQPQADSYVEERLLANLTFIAKDMKIQVEFNSEQVLAYRLLGYENRAIADEDFRDDLVDAGEIGAGHRVTALYELVLTGGNPPAVNGAPQMVDGAAFDGEVEVSASDLVLVKVRYKDVDASELDEAYEVSASLAPGDVAASPSDLDDDFRWAVAVAAFAELLKGSPYADRSTLGSIRVIAEAQASRDADRAEFLSFFNLAAPMLSPR